MRISATTTVLQRAHRAAGPSSALQLSKTSFSVRPALPRVVSSLKAANVNLGVASIFMQQVATIPAADMAGRAPWRVCRAGDRGGGRHCPGCRPAALHRRACDSRPHEGALPSSHRPPAAGWRWWAALCALTDVQSSSNAPVVHWGQPLYLSFRTCASDNIDMNVHSRHLMGRRCCRRRSSRMIGSAS